MEVDDNFNNYDLENQTRTDKAIFVKNPFKPNSCHDKAK